LKINNTLGIEFLKEYAIYVEQQKATKNSLGMTLEVGKQS